MSKKLVALLVGITATTMFFQNCGMSMQQDDFGSTGIDVVNTSAVHTDRDHDPQKFAADKIEVRAKDLIAGRSLLVKQLTGVFGERVAVLDKDKISRDARNFGGPCSMYEHYNYVTTTGVLASADPNANCQSSNSASALRASLYPETSTIRQGTMEHLCRALTADKTARQVALKKLSADGKPKATKENVLKAFRMFYRSAPLPPDPVLESMQVMMPSENVTEEQWTPVLFTLCVSPGWQVL